MEGKVAAYGYEELFKVHAVTVIPTVRSYTGSERNDRGSKGYYEYSGKKFSEILDKEMDNRQAEDIEFKATGYTKDAKAFYMLYRSHTYA